NQLSPPGPHTSTVDYCAACTTCSCPGTGTGKDYSNQTLTRVNFYALGEDLTGANFAGSTLIACAFDRVDLTDANFTGAVFQPDSLGTVTSFSAATLTNTCFTQTDLANVNFFYTVFDNTNFTCADIANSTFGPIMFFAGDTSTRTKFNYAQIAMADSQYLFPLNNFAPSDWTKTDFSYARFNGLSESNFQPRGKDLSYAKLAGIHLPAYDLSHCTLTQADLTGATLNYANLDSIVAYGVRLDSASMLQTSLRGADFYSTEFPGSSFVNAAMNSVTLKNANVKYGVFTGAILNGAQAQNASFNYGNFQGGTSLPTTKLTGADFSGADLSYAQLDRVSFNNNFLIDSKFQYLDASNTQFFDLIMTGADFFNSTLQEVSFRGATLHNANFSSCTFNKLTNGNGVSFECALLGGANFANAVVNMADFSYAVIPPDTACCLLVDSSYNCGTDPWDGLVYGATTLPVLTVPVPCPDGRSTAICSGTQWQIPNWQTNQCNPDNKEVTVWAAPDCNGHRDTTGITITDPSLKQCIADQLFDGDTTQVITHDLALTITSLSCGQMGIKDLTGLDSFPNLLYLDLTANDLTLDQFSTLSTRLTTLKVPYNSLTSISLSSHQSDMLFLDASNNQISSINLATSYLTYLDLSHNQLANSLASIELFTDLNYLNLSYNKLTDVGQLDGLQDLGSLFLDNNLLTNIGDLGDLWSCGRGVLYEINLQNNDCFECSSLDPSGNCSQYDIVSMSFCECQPSCTNCGTTQ
ncbi:MAG: pentapeptide repeat-containing protein, partial [Bacteroidota bacterium]